MLTAEPAARYEVIAKSMAFDHEMFSHGDVVEEQQLGPRIYQLLRAGLIRKLPSIAAEEQSGVNALPSS